MSVPEIARDPTPSEPGARDALDAVPRPIGRHEPIQSTLHDPDDLDEPRDPGEHRQPREPGGSLQQPASRRTLVIALVILLTLTLLTVFSQLRTTAALEAQVATLEGEVAQAQAAVASYRSRFTLVRDEVAGLVTRIGALSSLVASPVHEASEARDPGVDRAVDSADPVSAGDQAFDRPPISDP